MKYFEYEDKNDHYAINEENNSFSILSGERVPINNRIRLGYGKTDSDYLESGKNSVKRMFEVLRQANLVIAHDSKVLDFGCAGGRMLRWIPEYIKNGQYWGVDTECKAIIWAQQNLDDRFNFITTLREPHLPFEDSCFDFIYAGSVFSHIHDLSDMWFLELKRILRPAGVLFASFQDEHSIDIIKRQSTEGTRVYYRKLFVDNDLGKYLQSKYNKIVIGKNDYTSQVFYDSNYLCAHLKKFFGKVERTKEAYGWQSAVLLVK